MSFKQFSLDFLFVSKFSFLIFYLWCLASKALTALDFSTLLATATVVTCRMVSDKILGSKKICFISQQLLIICQYDWAKFLYL